MKKYISILGTSGVGKTTILEYLKAFYSNTVFIVPQVTTRPPRSDDNPLFIKCQKSINEEDLFVVNSRGTYGILNSDIKKFEESNMNTAVSINWVDEVINLKEKKCDFDFNTVLYTYTNNHVSEIDVMKRTMIALFDETRANSRISFFSKNIREHLLNPEFIDKYVDLHLIRDHDDATNMKKFMNVVVGNDVHSHSRCPDFHNFLQTRKKSKKRSLILE